MFLVSISCAWVAGIFLGSIYSSPYYLMFTGLIPVPLVFKFHSYRKQLILACLSLITLFGAAFYYSASAQPDKTSSFNNQAGIEIKGVIISMPEIRNNTTHLEIGNLEFKVDSGQLKVPGKVIVLASRYPEYRYGDVLVLKGKLEDPPKSADFDYQAYLARDGIYSIMLHPQIQVTAKESGFKPLAWIYALRERLSSVLSQALPEPQASLAQGIVLGINSSIPDSLRTNLSVTGTAHLLAISGINLSIIAGLLITLGLWVFGRRHYIYVWLALFVIWFYALITGMQAPVIRSAIMATMVLLAELLGRQKSALVPLAFSAAIMVGITPQILWSVSFQLSFLSMLGLILIAPSLQNAGQKMVHAFLEEEAWGARAAVLITDSLSVTLGAILMIWPIAAYNFGLVSFIGPLSTLLASPSLPFIIILGALTAFTGLISLPAAQVMGWATWLFLSYMLGLVNALASLPAASIRTEIINIDFIRVYYGILVILIGLKSKLATYKSWIVQAVNKSRPILSKSEQTFNALPKQWVIIPLALVAFLTTFTAVTLPDNNLHVSILDVGEGDSILIQSRNQTILIDGGPDPQAVCLGLSNKMPFWHRSIDLLVLTHPHLDHLSGLIEVLKRYQVGQVLAPNLTSPSPSYQEWLNLIKNKNIKYTLAQSGQTLKMGNGAILEVLNPLDTRPGQTESDLEDQGIVVRLQSNQVSFLFTADIGSEAEAALISRRAELVSTVLKVAHHGSSTSTSTNFLNLAHPQIAVISASADNSFGHPDKKVIARLAEIMGSENNIYRTDRSGTIEFTTDGNNLWVKTH